VFIVELFDVKLLFVGSGHNQTMPGQNEKHT